MGLLSELFPDPQIVGKKRGYDKAADEYKQPLEKLKQECEQIEYAIKYKKDQLNNQIDSLIIKLELLENQEKKLKKKVLWANSMLCSTLCSASLITDIWMFLCSSKIKKAEQEGYQEAKQVFAKKVLDLKLRILNLKDQANTQIHRQIDTIIELLDSISKTEAKIAELKLMLTMG